jgi:hypothetical protein
MVVNFILKKEKKMTENKTWPYLKESGSTMANFQITM